MRACALELAGPLGHTLVVHEAERVVGELFQKPMLKPDVLASLRRDDTLSEPVGSKLWRSRSRRRSIPTFSTELPGPSSRSPVPIRTLFAWHSSKRRPPAG